MQFKCEHCGQLLDDQTEKCPNCGAPNIHLARVADGEPKTIDELKKYCEDNDFTAEKTRFFVGVNYAWPKAFGIYKDGNGDFVVYKNKADGTRSVRYKGKDEAYAVHELYQRLQDEILNQKRSHFDKRMHGVQDDFYKWIPKRPKGIHASTFSIKEGLCFVAAFAILIIGLSLSANGITINILLCVKLV